MKSAHVTNKQLCNLRESGAYCHAFHSSLHFLGAIYCNGINAIPNERMESFIVHSLHLHILFQLGRGLAFVDNLPRS